jgi:hypothetical protein
MSEVMRIPLAIEQGDAQATFAKFCEGVEGGVSPDSKTGGRPPIQAEGPTKLAVWIAASVKAESPPAARKSPAHLDPRILRLGR